MSTLFDSAITTVVPWFGSNRMLANEVGEAVGKQKWVGVPFAGGMSELPHLHARSIVANDLHRHVINLARVMADPDLGGQLYRQLRRLPLHPDVLAAAQDRCRSVEIAFATDPDLSSKLGEANLPWALDYFIAAWMGRSCNAGTSGEFKGGISTRWKPSGGDSAVRVHSAVGGIPAWRRAFRNTTFTTMDAIAFIKKVKDDDGHAIYCDPDFPGPGKAYKHHVDHHQLVAAVSRFEKTRVVMRFYDVPLIRELYPDTLWDWRLFTGRTQANKESPEVLLVLNGDGGVR